MTWRELNDQLRKAKDVKVILQLYKAERKGKRRKRWLTRIYCRHSSVRQKKENESSRISRTIHLNDQSSILVLLNNPHSEYRRRRSPIRLVRIS